MSEEKLVIIKSGESKTLDVLNKIFIHKIAIYGEEINVILNQIINGECKLYLSLVGDRKEFYEFDLANLITKSDDYENWKVCVFELKFDIVFPEINWGKHYNDVENQIKIEFKSQDEKLHIVLLYTIENYKYI